MNASHPGHLLHRETNAVAGDSGARKDSHLAPLPSRPTHLEIPIQPSEFLQGVRPQTGLCVGAYERMEPSGVRQLGPAAPYIGSTGVPLRRTSKWRWGPVLRPVLPT